MKLSHRSAHPPPGRGCYWDEHCLVKARSGAVLTYPEWEWADADRDGIVFAEQGSLFRQRLTADGSLDPQLLRDFNGDRFEGRQAPY